MRSKIHKIFSSGGRPDMAQAGGPDGAKADAALKAIEAALAG
jgi:alanyl-tRNA synthetase